MVGILPVNLTDMVGNRRGDHSIQLHSIISSFSLHMTFSDNSERN